MLPWRRCYPICGWQTPTIAAFLLRETAVTQRDLLLTSPQNLLLGALGKERCRTRASHDVPRSSEKRCLLHAYADVGSYLRHHLWLLLTGYWSLHIGLNETKRGSSLFTDSPAYWARSVLVYLIVRLSFASHLSAEMRVGFTWNIVSVWYMLQCIMPCLPRAGSHICSATCGPIKGL
jgi:hypothetical protein